MERKNGIILRLKKMFLSMALCVALILCVGTFCFSLSRENAQEVFAATNSPSFTLSDVKIYDTNKGNTSSNTISPSELAYSSMVNVASDSHISAAISDNKVQIESTSNLHYEACYADVTASIVVPAYHEYKVKYTINSSIIRTNSSSPNGTGCEIYDFGNDTLKGSDVGFVFRSSQNVSTTPSDYTKKSTYSVNSSEHKETYTTLLLTYTNISDEAVEFRHNFGVFAYCRATTNNNTKITATFDFISQVEDEKLTVTKPTEDKNQYSYTGNPQTYVPVGWDANKMGITEDSDSMTQTNAGTYIINIQPLDCPWDDMTREILTFTFKIEKAKPNVQPQYEHKAVRYVSEGLPTVTNIAGGVPGSFSWGTQTPSIEQKEYTWTFTPDDKDNYEVQTGKETFNFVAPEIKDILVKVNDGDVVYDAFDMEEIKKHITVKAQYEDGSERILSNDGYEVRTQDGTLSAGETEITVLVWDGTYDDFGNKNTIKKKVVIHIDKAIIESLDVYCSTTFTYPVTKDEILAALEVESDWNYTNKPVKITDKTVLQLDGEIKAGKQTFTVTYKGTNLSENIVLTINKGTYDLSGIRFEDKSFEYDSNPHSIEISGDLPNGISVTYENNGKIEVGKYTVIVKFSHENPNYNDIQPMKATLEIVAKTENPNEPDTPNEPITPIEPNEPNSPDNPSDGNSINFDKVLDILKQWWQVIASVASILFILIFTARGLSYIAKIRDNKKTIESKYRTFYVISGVGLFEISMKNWTIIAGVLMGVAVLSLVFMLIEKKRYKKSQRNLEDAKDEYTKMMLMGMMGGNNNGSGQQNYAYAQPAIGIEDMRGMINEAVTSLLPNSQQYLPQQASNNDELLQKLIEQNERNEEKIRQLNAENEERIKQLTKNNEQVIEKLMTKLSEPQPIERVIEKQVATSGSHAVEKLVQVGNYDDRIDLLMRNQEMLMKQMIELSSKNGERQVVEKVVEVPVEKIVEKEVVKEVPVEVEKIVEKEVRVEVPIEVEKVVEKIVEIPVEKVVPLAVSKPVSKTKSTTAPRLTLDDAYAKLSVKQKKIFDTLKEYAMSKDKCKEKKSTYYILFGQSSVNPLVKLTIKKDTTVALFKMEDEYMKDIRRNATSDGTKVKVKETELVVGDSQALATAKEMIDLREDQIERYNDYLKEQRSMKKR